MKWKKLYSFLLICTAVIVFIEVLNMTSITYADTSRTWEKADIKNILYKMMLNDNPNYSEQYIQLINSKETELDIITQEMNNNTGIAVGQSDINTVLFVKITSYGSGWYLYRNQPIMNGDWYKVYAINMTNSDITINSSTTDISSSWNWKTNYSYNGRNVFAESTFQNKIWNAGDYRPDTFFNEWYYKDININFDYPETLIKRTYDTNIRFYAVGVQSNIQLTDLKLQDEQGNYYGGINQFQTIYEEEDNYSYQLWLYSENAPSIYKKYRAVAFKNNEVKATTDYTLQLRYLKSGTITNESGDTTGSINLGPINNNLENINNSIEEQTQAIISGDNKIIQAIESGEKKAEERQSFWEKAYNDLFYVSGEEIENKITKLYEELELPSGEVSGELAGLDVIKANPRRFYNSMERI